MIDISAARKLLDFGTRLGNTSRAEEQLQGAVALYNILQRHRVAYLADEVGMGKTYVALGTLALFRHFQPDFRAAIIVPRENLQRKWNKELRNFVRHNVRFADLRVKAVDGRPAREPCPCESLLQFAREASLDSDRDFILRLPSFSLSLAGQGDEVDTEKARELRNRLREVLPWLPAEAFDLRRKEDFKKQVAIAVCCALPVFDLLIVDEGHNLKHGRGEGAAVRNRVLAHAFSAVKEGVDRRLFPSYGPKAKRVLFLSATPLEESYRYLWNQLDVFGLGRDFERLRDEKADEKEKKQLASKLVVRRVTTITTGGRQLTRNMYRREWRAGGVKVHDEPMRIEGVRERLLVALVQKKVSELLGHERFGARFQIGMLASFESFLETAKIKRDGDKPEANFDNPEQTDDELERDGLDVRDLNRLSNDYFRNFQHEMPHPKMDALVDALSDAWQKGRKGLVFVRRIASVKEIRQKLNERYDRWLMDKLRRELPHKVHRRLEKIFERYRRKKQQARERGIVGSEDSSLDTFFAWFFRGAGPRHVLSGIRLRQRFLSGQSPLSTFFSQNYVARVLGCHPEQVEKTLVEIGTKSILGDIAAGAKQYLGATGRLTRLAQFEAVQAAAIHLLKERTDQIGTRAQVVWNIRFHSLSVGSPGEVLPEVSPWLGVRTFFTEIRRRPELAKRIWPIREEDIERSDAFAEEERRARLLAAVARLGHAFIDFYIMTIQRLGSLRERVQQIHEGGRADAELDRIHAYLDLLEHQMNTPLGQRDFAAFDELEAVAQNFDLIMDVNAPDIRETNLEEASRFFGNMLGEQQPVGGMFGKVNDTLVRQFRMPGYPFVLVTTDLLQEGEDLHPFCAAIYHYGISWTPSAMEQRIGRIDRVRSKTDRWLGQLRTTPTGEDKLQVYFPHLQDTVEILQVRTVLERMDTFLRLMHEGLVPKETFPSHIDTRQEFAAIKTGEAPAVPADQLLESSFPVKEEHLHGRIRSLAVGPNRARKLKNRFLRLGQQQLIDLNITWEPATESHILLGTAQLGDRRQPFELLLESIEGEPAVRCVSPVGRVAKQIIEELDIHCPHLRVPRVGAILSEETGTYNLTVEDIVLLCGDEHSDRERVSLMVKRVVEDADTLERWCLPGKDQPLDDFREDLEEKEPEHVR